MTCWKGAGADLHTGCVGFRFRENDFVAVFSGWFTVFAGSLTALSGILVVVVASAAFTFV